MSDKLLTPRQEAILFYCQPHQAYTLREIGQLLERASLPAPSDPTLRRDLTVLVKSNFFAQIGERKATRYQLNLANQLFVPIDAHNYCQIDIDDRPANTRFNAELLANAQESLFTAKELTHLQDATEKYRELGQGASPAIRKRELERFVIELSWKSSKIEGNTYTLLDTEILLKEGIEAEGKTREEAVMILNHKSAFDFILEFRTDFKTPKLALIRDLHRLLVKDLQISFGLRNRLIGITGSVYKPLQIPTQIEEACIELLNVVSRFSDPFSKALLMLAAIAYIQPFEDGNKRTSRLSANAILLAADCAPLSYRSVSELSYREAMLTFYERNTILPIKEIFIQQYLFAAINYLRVV